MRLGNMSLNEVGEIYRGNLMCMHNSQPHTPAPDNATKKGNNSADKYFVI